MLTQMKGSDNKRVRYEMLVDLHIVRESRFWFLLRQTTKL